MKIFNFRNLLFLLALLAVCFLIPVLAVEPADTVLQPNDRIVFVGDSITGQGWNNKTDGFIHLIDNALRQAHPDSTGVRIALGGSGQTVGSWQNVEKGSRDKSTILDAKDFDVKTELDKPADVLIIMLGMNDILGHYVSDTTEGQDNWLKQYRQLISVLRDRVKPRVIGLATITPYSENLTSPANRLRDALNRRVAILADEEKCLFLPSGQRAAEILQRGRTYVPYFHVTADYVHPSKAGHVAIAAGMLDGLGEHALAQQLTDKFWQQAMPKKPSLSYNIENIEGKLDAPVSTFHIRYWFNSEAAPKQLQVRLITPAGWSTTENVLNMTTGEFTLTGSNYKFKTPLTLEARDGDIVTTAVVNIPAPWLVATGASYNAAYPGNTYNPATAVLPADDKMMAGEGFGQPVIITPTQSLTWHRYFASVDYTGGDDPDSVSFLALNYYSLFHVGYCARWIYSERDRAVKVTPGSRAFAGTNMATVWMNAEQIYTGQLTRTAVDSKLKAGWNLFVYRSNHLQWQWQATISMAGVDGDDLADLRYSVQLTRPTEKP